MSNNSKFHDYEQFLALLGTIFLVGTFLTVCLFRMASCQEKYIDRINRVVAVP